MSILPGYRELSEEEKNLIASFRELGSKFADACATSVQTGADPRWIAIAKTHFQEGLMAAVRGITKPDFF